MFGSPLRRMSKISIALNGTWMLLMFSTIMTLSCLALMTREVEALTKPKAIKPDFASSSLLMKGPRRILRHHRLRRDTYADDDENYEIIPSFAGQVEDGPKSPGDHISEKAEQIAQTFANMWQSMVDTAKHFADAIRQLFTADEEEYHLTAEEMAARGQAIEEQNEIWRSTYENQL
ncbi:uncharacterized protein LOC105261794 [Musca domestica]|uniref:Uncharacterized protein LOC105261794 n=1 Tax=Musca domestica TaxID=7370 RepID=A0A1I8NKA3_MUSDO|nr:uncharacterized protein LOC105261794 [Musca domestica]